MCSNGGMLGLFARPLIRLSLALLLTAIGALVPEGFWLCLPATALALLVVFRPAEGQPVPPRSLVTAALCAPVLVLLTVFTVRVAVPNIVSAGTAANDALAASTLRTLLWAEDQMVLQTGRAGTLAELAAITPLEDGRPLPAPLLRAEMFPLAQGLSVLSGYAYRIDVSEGGGRAGQNGRHFIAYAWPVLPGRSGRRIYCLNEHEDIFGADISASPASVPLYAGFSHQPAWSACLPPGARFGDRPVGGVGGDGGVWQRWKGRPTRRARGDAPASGGP